MELQRFEGVRLFECGTAVVGSGAAGLNAADRLWALGQCDIALVTEHVNAGTSRNTGSDKQTYYKLTLSGSDPDSVREMAQTLFAGQCVDGDIALCEAALSTRCFLKLAELGVPFPQNRYGEYIGYKTDHDPRRRATSAGPYTSRSMTECLERAVRADGVPILDKLQVIRILSDGREAAGLLCLDTAAADRPEDRFVLIRCKNIVWATGGPAGMYADSVYPLGHYGATGLALEAGAHGKNLTEWQYGLASLHPRWNVSGTYMQVLPRFISTRADGSDEREFLNGFFARPSDLLTKVFLKGYQWPFDVRRVADGSSILDILVYLERRKGRRVFLDYRSDPCGGVDFSQLGDEARAYLQKAGACFGTPFERLLHMNEPAVAFYRDKGVDLAAQPLEIALCAQHNNGGLSIDAWWQTDVTGLFAVGEAAASHGVYRPGGSALNAGQVGSTRAAQYIAARRTGRQQNGVLFSALARAALQWARSLADSSLTGKTGTVQAQWDAAALRMSLAGAALRSPGQLRAAAGELARQRRSFGAEVRAASCADLRRVYRLWEMLVCQTVYLGAMLDYLEQGGKSRGSALYTDLSGTKPYAFLPDEFTFSLDGGERGGLVQEALWTDGACSFVWRPVRPIPEDDDFFENVWRSYRESGNIG